MANGKNYPIQTEGPGELHVNELKLTAYHEDTVLEFWLTPEDARFLALMLFAGAADKEEREGGPTH